MKTQTVQLAEAAAGRDERLAGAQARFDRTVDAIWRAYNKERAAINDQFPRDTDSLCWKCSSPQEFLGRCPCGAINPNVDLDGALRQVEAAT